MLESKIKKLVGIGGIFLTSLLNIPPSVAAESRDFNIGVRGRSYHENKFWNRNYDVDKCKEKLEFCAQTTIGGNKVEVHMYGENVGIRDATSGQYFYVNSNINGEVIPVLRLGSYSFEPHIDNSKPNLKLEVYSIPDITYSRIRQCESREDVYRMIGLCSIPEDKIMFENLLSGGLFVEDKDRCLYKRREFRNAINLTSDLGDALIKCERKRDNTQRVKYLENLVRIQQKNK